MQVHCWNGNDLKVVDSLIEHVAFRRVRESVNDVELHAMAEILSPFPSLIGDIEQIATRKCEATLICITSTLWVILDGLEISHNVFINVLQRRHLKHEVNLFYAFLSAKRMQQDLGQLRYKSIV